MYDITINFCTRCCLQYLQNLLLLTYVHIWLNVFRICSHKHVSIRISVNASLSNWHICMRIYVQKYAVLHYSYITFTYTYTYIHIHAYWHIYTYVHMHIYIYIYIYIYTCRAVGNILPLHHLKNLCIVETDKHLRLYKSNIHIFTHTCRKHIYTRTCVYIYMYPHL